MRPSHAAASTLSRAMRAGACAMLCTMAAPMAWAQASAAPTPATTAAAPLVPYFAPDPELLSAFGGKEGITQLADVFVDRMKADAKIGAYFNDTNIPRLKGLLRDQLCQVLAGPCVYDGETMKASHAGLGISKADSLRQVEILQDSMDQLRIPFSSQNKLLARLAPMYREIIER